MPPKKKTKLDMQFVKAPPVPKELWERWVLPGQWAPIAAETVSMLSSLTSGSIGMVDQGAAVTYDLDRMVITAEDGTSMPMRKLVPGAWEWKDDQGLWTQYFDDDTDVIEHEWRRVAPGGGTVRTANLSFNAGFWSMYTFDFKVDGTGQVVGLQKNEDSGTERDIRRSCASALATVWDTANFGVAGKAAPTEADAAVVVAAAAPADGGLQRADTFTSTLLAAPDYWEPQQKPLQYFTVAEGTQEFDRVIKPFLATMGPGWGGKSKTTIQKVQRIQNQNLWKFYALVRHRVAMRNNGDSKEMTQLYHGCRVRENLNAIIEFGFDMRVARDGLSGMGIYFATNTRYSNCGYVLQNPDGSKEMLVCRVAIGSYTQGKTGMKRPPAKKGKGANAELYDSVARLPDMHVVFDNMQAYPEYLVKYKQV